MSIYMDLDGKVASQGGTLNPHGIDLASSVIASMWVKKFLVHPDWRWQM